MARLFNADCLETLKTLDDASVDAVITDPPYGVLQHKIETGVTIPELLAELKRVVKPNGFIVYFGQQPTLTDWNYHANQLFKYKSEVIWYKRNATSFLNDMCRVYENIMIYCNGSRKLNQVKIPFTDLKRSLADLEEADSVLSYISKMESIFKSPDKQEAVKQWLNGHTAYNRVKKVNDYGMIRDKNFKDKKSFLNDFQTVTTGYKPRNLVSFTPHNKQQYGKDEYNIKHPTVKPIQLMQWLIELTSNERDIVLDCFMGSGTTGIAAKQLGREFIGIELDPDYFEIAKTRIEAAEAVTTTPDNIKQFKQASVALEEEEQMSFEL